MKRILGLGFVAFLVALAVVIGRRMSTDAMAVVIGVMFGVAASIPTSLLIMAATRRGGGERVEGGRPSYERYAPPVIVISPNSPQAGPSSPTSLIPPAFPTEERRFRIVGEDGWLDGQDSDAVDAQDWRHA